MRRIHSIVGALLIGGIVLTGCGQPLALPGDNQAQGGLPTAAPDQFNEEPGGSPVAPDASAAPSDPFAVPEAAASADPVVSDAPSVSSDAPSAATDAPPPPVASPEPTVNPTFEDVAVLPSVQDRWRYVQVERNVLPTVQTYRTTGSEILWWYDPVFGRTIKLGEIQGSFPVQATFRFRGQEAEALEIPYQVNQSFGITLPQAVLNQMQQAGVGEWAEAFVYVDSDISPE